jgi:N-acetylmuramoyl-L-alanine amidase
MRIVRHKLTGDLRVAPFARARNIDEAIAPELVVLHDTASSIDHGSVARFLRESPRVSVHFVIERDGTIEQQIPTNRAGDHAGQSHYHGRDGVNAFSIGIELVNPGLMEASSDNPAWVRAWWDQTFGVADYGIVRRRTPEHGDGWWMPHTRPQIAALLDLLDALFASVPTLRDIRGHWYVSPGRKIDPGPTLDIEAIRARVLGPTDPVEADLDARGEDLRVDGAPPHARVSTNGGNLNLRRWPSFNPNVIGSIPDGTPLEVIRGGEFGGRRWSRVDHGGREGWVVDTYLEFL